MKWNDFIPNVTVAATSGLDSITNIVRARRLGLFGHVARSVVMFQRPTSSVSAVLLKMDILPTIFGSAQVDMLEPPALITSLLTLACLCPKHFLRHKIVRSGGHSLRPQRLRVPDWLTVNPRARPAVGLPTLNACRYCLWQGYVILGIFNGVTILMALSEGKKVWRYTQLFRHTRVWRTDRRTHGLADGQKSRIIIAHQHVDSR